MSYLISFRYFLCAAVPCFYFEDHCFAVVTTVSIPSVHVTRKSRKSEIVGRCGPVSATALQQRYLFINTIWRGQLLLWNVTNSCLVWLFVYSNKQKVLEQKENRQKTWRGCVETVKVCDEPHFFLRVTVVCERTILMSSWSDSSSPHHRHWASLCVWYRPIKVQQVTVTSPGHMFHQLLLLLFTHLQCVSQMMLCVVVCVLLCASGLAGPSHSSRDQQVKLDPELNMNIVSAQRTSTVTVTADVSHARVSTSWL